MSISKRILNRKINVDIFVANKSNISINRIYTCLVDTGSVESLISDKIINDLGLTHSEEYVTIIDSNNNEIKSHRFPCYLMFNGHKKTFDMNIGTIKRENVDIIIGMDILELVEINIRNGIFTIS
jgi:hypothetical protein